MMKKIRLYFFLLFLTLYPVPYTLYPVYAEASCDPSACGSDDVSCLTDVTNKCEQQLQVTRGQEKTLTSQLAIIDGQTKVTNLKIQETNAKIATLKRQISDLGTRIDRISGTLDSLSELLLKRIVQTYKYGNTDSAFNLIFSSGNITDLLERLKYIQVAQAYDKQKLYELQATKLDYNDQKQDKVTRQAEAEKLSKDLDTYQKQLTDQKKTKQELLSETQGNEATYEKLLAQAQSQLAGFTSFTGGNSSILSGQTVCDEWGCYYNQRDSQWGNVGLNGTGDRIADIGCLMTSMAMVYTHYGHKDVTPLSINANSDNFAAYAPTFLKYSISANGISSSRAGSVIDGELAAGRPVIVGIGRGPDHFVVLLSGSGGNYKMNDPFVPNGHNISFTDHYSIGSIHEIDKVTF